MQRQTGGGKGARAPRVCVGVDAYNSLVSCIEWLLVLCFYIILYINIYIACGLSSSGAGDDGAARRGGLGGAQGQGGAQGSRGRASRGAKAAGGGWRCSR